MVNVNYKNSQTLLYCHFNKIIKGPGASFQSPALSQKHVRNVCHAINFILMVLRIKKKLPLCNFHYAYDDISDSEICRFHKNRKI